MDRSTLHITIPSYMVDVNSRLRAASFMELAQEIAGIDVGRTGMSDKDLAPINGVWILAKMHIHFDRVPRRFDEIDLSTWHRGQDGAKFIRDYEMNDAEGNPVIRATSSWIIMDIDDRKILRGDILEPFIKEDAAVQEYAIEEYCPKISFPPDAEVISGTVHKVCYSDIDYNRHTNNTKYILWSLDALPSEITTGSDISDIIINFNREAHLGEEVSIVAGRKDGEYYIIGKCEDERIFTAKFIFA